jgi:uncharacterized protein
MRFEMGPLRREPGRTFQLIGEEAIPLLSWWDEELALEGPVHVAARAFYQEERIYLTLRVQGRIHRRCSRCLRDVMEAFDAENLFDVEMDEPDVDYLELQPVVEVAVRLAIGRRPLCRPDCLGICPRCGADLNVEGHRPGCDAQAPKLDPRLQKLRELL